MTSADGRGEHRGAGPDASAVAAVAVAAPPARAPEQVALCDLSGRVLSSGPYPALAAPVAALVARRGPAVAADGRPAVEDLALAPDADSGHAARIVECLIAPVPGPDGAVGSLAVVVRDVTEVRRAEEAVRESERQYRLLAENATDLISRHDPSGRYLYVSPASRALIGYAPEELVGTSPYDYIHSDDLPDVHRVHSLMLTSRESYTVSFRGRRKEGAYVWLETTARAVRDEVSGRVIEIQCATRDITLRKQAEQELREGRELFQAVLDNCPAVVSIKDVQGRYLLVNRRFEGLHGVSRRGALGRTDAQLFSATAAAAARSADRAVLVSGRAVEAEEVVTPPVPSGGPEPAPHFLLTVRFPLCDRDGSAFAVCSIAADITARRKAEEALREKSAVLRSILDDMADAVIVADTAEHFLEFNPAAERMFGGGAADVPAADWPERYGLFLPDATTPFPADDLPLTRALRGQAVTDVEMFVRHAGRPEGAWIIVSGRPLCGSDGRVKGGVIVCREITERRTAEQVLRDQNVRLREAAEAERQAHDALKQAEVQLVQAEKLTALGQMVAGVAHEVNNPLAFVSNNVAVLQRDVESLGKLVRLYQQTDGLIEQSAPEVFTAVRALAEEIDLEYTLDNLGRLTGRSREGLRRIQQIVKDLREFARPDEGDLEAVDLNPGVASTVNIITGRAKDQGVQVVSELNPLPPVTCHPAKINQVVMNLLANAIDATPAGGRVTVRTEAAPGADGVVLRVADTGSGIEPAVRDRIFDPFFTTKPVGQGTGLGLSISYGIVKAHGGTIAVESEPGRGSVFTIRLPLTPPARALTGP